jgi:hypothetical protein
MFHPENDFVIQNGHGARIETRSGNWRYDDLRVGRWRHVHANYFSIAKEKKARPLRAAPSTLTVIGIPACTVSEC